MIEIFILTYNEEVMLPFTINFYRTRFPDCTITLYDNESTDSTIDIAISNNCNVISYSTNNQLSDRKYLEIKNSCYKKASTNWVLVADCDELLDIDYKQLSMEKGTVIKSRAYHMINLNNNLDIRSINHGVRDKVYDKTLLFNRSKIHLTYQPGAHKAFTSGTRIYGNTYDLYHYKYINPDYLVNRYRIFGQRISEDNKKNSWGGQFLEPEQNIRTNFEQLRKEAIQLWK